MSGIQEYPERRRLRVAGHDYASPGYYFITLCTEGRTCLFGSITDGMMHLSPAGEMVKAIWEEMPEHYPGVDVDAMVVMPNHIHGIVVLLADSASGNGRADTGGSAPTRGPSQAETPKDVGRLSLPEVMRRFKSLTVMRYGIGVRSDGWPRYDGQLWQRSYYERVIRNDRELESVRLYIVENPLKWVLDRENPAYSGRS